MNPTVHLVGLDFGTTTMSAVIAEAELARNAVTGRTDLQSLRERYRSEMVFTPIIDDRIDEAEVATQLDRWLALGGVAPDRIFGGGALLTGLTAQRDNAASLVGLIRARLGDTLIATANDPCLESWLAFMGSCADLSRSMPDERVLNLDIGGGTTNLALGKAGEVLRTGCLFVGARHVQVEPGTYRITRLSRYARSLLDHLKIGRGVGETLTSNEVGGIVDYYADLLTAVLKGDRRLLDDPTARLHEQVPFQSQESANCILTLSGGVGELVYAHLDRKPWPTTTAFGDLGIDLAQRLAERWGNDLRRHRPASAGRATVYGLLRHSTEISGSTLYLPDPTLLPLSDLPIVGSISAASSDDALRLASRCETGACVRVELDNRDANAIRTVGDRIAGILETIAFPADQPLVLLVKENIGKALGQYASRWGTLPVKLLVIDEMPERNAQYARIGRMRQQVVPVSYYGLKE